MIEGEKCHIPKLLIAQSCTFITVVALLMAWELVKHAKILTLQCLSAIMQTKENLNAHPFHKYLTMETLEMVMGGF